MLKHIDRWKRNPVTVNQNEVVVLDLSLPQDAVRGGYLWVDFINFCDKNFSDNVFHSMESDGMYDKLVLRGTIEDIACIVELFMERKAKRFKQFRNGQLRRVLIAYLNRIRTFKNIECLEMYCKKNLGWTY